jgi:hypothetical protein
MDSLTLKRKRELRDLARTKLNLPKNAPLKKIIKELGSEKVNSDNFYSQMLKFEKANERAMDKIKEKEQDDKYKELFRKERAEVKSHRERIKELEKRMKEKENKIKNEKIQNLFPFASDVFEASNTSLKKYEPKVSSQKFKNVAEVIEFDLDGRFSQIHDIDTLGRSMKNSVMDQLKQIFAKHGTFKVILGVEVRIIRENLRGGNEVSSLALFQSSSSRRDDHQILRVNDFSRVYNNAIEKIKRDIEEYIRNGSQWRIRSFQRFFIKVVKYKSFVILS